MKKLIYIEENFITPDECQQFIDFAVDNKNISLWPAFFIFRFFLEEEGRTTFFFGISYTKWFLINNNTKQHARTHTQGEFLYSTIKIK